MEGLVCLDASVLIGYFRNRNKKETFFPWLSLNCPGFVLPAIAHFKIYTGCTLQQKIFWDNLFADFLILPFTSSVSFEAVLIQKQLKTSGINIEFKDLAIAATAKSYGYPLATLNERHFINISGLQLITPSSFFFNYTATTEIYTLSLHDALPI